MVASSYGSDFYDAYYAIFGSPVLWGGSLIWSILLLVGYWKVFQKAGHAGWKCLIPFYNWYILYEIAFGKGKGWMFLLMLIPCVGFIVEIMRAFKMAKAYGKGTGFGFGLLFLQPIFILILGFGDAQYVGANIEQ